MSDWPILEYDPNPDAILMPRHDGLHIALPEVAVFAFVGELVEDWARERELPLLGVFDTITKDFPIYRYSDKVCLCQAPLGASAAAQFMDWLIAYGVNRIVSTGSCGVLVDLPENAFILPRRALRDEGTSYHYLPPSRWVELDAGMQARIADALRREGVPFVECDTWTTDGFFRETADRTARRRAEGCGVVEMECAALAACARFRGAAFGQFFFTADSLADADAHDTRGWGRASLLPALELCLKVAEEA